MSSVPMTQRDRDKLAGLARKRAKLAKSMIGERVKVLRSEVEDQLSAEHKFDDELWADVNRQAQAAVAQADAHVAEVCRNLGIPENLRPSIGVGWQGRGENAQASRRTELRKLAHARIDAAAESAKVAIECAQVDVETHLIRDGLESAEAVAFLESMPTVETLMPTVEVGALEKPDDERQRRYESWTPPIGSANALLVPSSASSRRDKQDAITRALMTTPDASDREIARRAGVDHKTVAKHRGESPTRLGNFPRAVRHEPPPTPRPEPRHPA